MEIATGASKDALCKEWNISLSQLNRILSDADQEAEAWYKSLARTLMVQIFRHNSENVFHEILRLEEIRSTVKDPRVGFDMTLKIINAYYNYNKMIAEGPSITRQKEIIQAAEKLQESRSR